MHLNRIFCQREKQLQVERNRWYCQQIFHLSHIILVSDWWSASDQSEGWVVPAWPIRGGAWGKHFIYPSFKLYSAVSQFSRFSSRLTWTEIWRTYWVRWQIRCISMCSSLFLKNVPIPVWARRWREGVGAVSRVPAVVHSLYCPLLKLAFCTDLRCDDLLMGEDWDDRMGNKHQLLATQGNFCRSVGLINILCPSQFSSLFIRLFLSITCFSSSRCIIFSSFSSSCFAWNLAWNKNINANQKSVWSEVYWQNWGIFC